MKKLLTILGAIGLTATAGATVVACGNKDKKDAEKPCDKHKIMAVLNHHNINVNDTVTLTVSDAIKFDDVTVVTAKENSNKIIITENKGDNSWSIKGAEKGTYTITVKVEGYADENLSLVVSEGLVKIDVQIDTSDLEVEGERTVTVSNYKELTNLTIESSNPDAILVDDFKDGKAIIKAKGEGTAAITVAADKAIDETFKLSVKEDEKATDKIQIDNLDSQANWIKTGDDGEIHAWIKNYEKLKNVQISTSDKSLEVLDNGQGKMHITGLKAGEFELKVSATDMKDFKTTIFVNDELIDFGSVVTDTELFVNSDSIETIYETIKTQYPAIDPNTKFFSEKGASEHEYVIWTNNYAGKLHFIYHVRTNISDIVIDNVEIKEKMDDVRAEINQTINQTVGFVVKEGEDYTVTGNTDRASQQITVTAMESSFKLQGQFKVEVNKFDISNLSLTVEPAELEDITSNIAPKVAGLIRNAITEPIAEIDLGTDFSIEANLPKVTPFGENVSRLTVTTNPNSNYIRGSFDIYIKPDLGEINVEPKGVVGLNESETTEKINEIIHRFAPEATENDWEITNIEIRENFEVLTISATENSDKIIGSFEITRRINISNLTLEETDLTPNQAKDKINKMIKDLAASYSVEVSADVDWTIVENKDENDEVVSLTVNASEESNAFVGSFTVPVVEKDILTNENLKTWIENQTLNFDIKIGTKQADLIKIMHHQIDALVKKEFDGTVWAFGFNESPNQKQLDSGKVSDAPDAGNVWRTGNEKNDHKALMTLGTTYGGKDAFDLSLSWTITFVA